MKPTHPLHGLVTATHTPFHPDGSLKLSAVAAQAAHLSKNGIGTVFIGGTTGECHSLALQERLDLAQRWSEVVPDSELHLVVQVGSNCLADARTLAAQAQKLGATAIAAMAPSYFKPRSLDVLIDCCADIAGAAPQTPFYFYDIPALTQVNFPMPDFLAQAKHRIPTLAGLKFTNPDLMAYQFCLQADHGPWDLPFGVEEHLLGALAMGAKGAVGSGFNFAAPIYHRMLAASTAGDSATARMEQFRGVQIVQLLSSFGYMAAAKALMGFLGVDVGPPRLPNPGLTPAQKEQLGRSLEAMGFFTWIP